MTDLKYFQTHEGWEGLAVETFDNPRSDKVIMITAFGDEEESIVVHLTRDDVERLHRHLGKILDVPNPTS